MHEIVATVNGQDKAIKNLVGILTTECPLVDRGFVIIDSLTEVTFSVIIFIDKSV